MGAQRGMRSPRVVLDTNVLVSALLFHAGTLSWLRTAWHMGSVRPLVSRHTVGELIRVLAYPKFHLGSRDREDLLADYLPWCKVVVVSEVPPVPHCRDPFDIPFLELTLTARADALVTGDHDLLALASRFPVPILTPPMFHERLCSTA